MELQQIFITILLLFFTVLSILIIPLWFGSRYKKLPNNLDKLFLFFISIISISMIGALLMDIFNVLFHHQNISMDHWCNQNSFNFKNRSRITILSVDICATTICCCNIFTVRYLQSMQSIKQKLQHNGFTSNFLNIACILICCLLILMIIGGDFYVMFYDNLYMSCHPQFCRKSRQIRGITMTVSGLFDILISFNAIYLLYKLSKYYLHHFDPEELLTNPYQHTYELRLIRLTVIFVAGILLHIIILCFKAIPNTMSLINHQTNMRYHCESRGYPNLEIQHTMMSVVYVTFLLWFLKGVIRIFDENEELEKVKNKSISSQIKSVLDEHGITDSKPSSISDKQ